MSTMLSSMGIDPGVIMILLMILDIALILVVLNLSMRVKRVNTRYRSFMKGEDGASLERELKQKMHRIEKYAANTGNLQEAIEEVSEIQKKSVHKYGMVKYDAFEDIGGKLSFALAMLDDNNTGFVLNAVHSKENCFLYLKEVVKGESYIMLSDEEVQALRIAEKYGSDNELLDV
jgi:hypothetical protein